MLSLKSQWYNLERRGRLWRTHHMDHCHTPTVEASWANPHIAPHRRGRGTAQTVRRGEHCFMGRTGIRGPIGPGEGRPFHVLLGPGPDDALQLSPDSHEQRAHRPADRPPSPSSTCARQAEREPWAQGSGGTGSSAPCRARASGVRAPGRGRHGPGLMSHPCGGFSQQRRRPPHGRTCHRWSVIARVGADAPWP
jgi:hypothetical protein